MIKHLAAVDRILTFGEKYPFLLVIIFALCVPSLVVYAAIYFVNASLAIFEMFLLLALVTLAYCAWVVKIVLRHWTQKE